MATYYVSKSTANASLGYVVGNDSNAGTSPATAWLTLAKITASAADGDTVYVNDGTYTDAELGGSNVFSLNSTKSIKMYPVTDYGVTLQSTAASAQIVSLTGTATNDMIFGKFIIDGEIPGAPGTYQPTGMVLTNPSNQAVITLSGTRFQNCATQNILNSKRRGTLNMTGVQFAGLMAQGVASTASGADVASMTVAVDGLALQDVTTSSNALTRVLDFTRLSSSSNTYTLTVSGVTGTITAPAALGSSAAVALLVATGIDGVIAEEFDATYYAYNTGATCYGIYIKNASRGATATANRPIIRHNRIVGNAPSEYVISAGDTTTAYDVDNAQVYGNTITVPYYDSATPHAVAVGNVTGGTVWGNWINGSYVAILLGINQGAAVTGNVSVGCYGMCLYAKGCGATTAPIIANNTVILTDTYGAARGGALAVAVQGATNNTAVTFRNNNVYAYTDMYRYTDVGTSQTATFVKNNYYSAGPAGFTSPWSYQSSTYTTFATWQAARETTGTNVDPIMVNVLAGDYRLHATSTLRHSGAPWGVRAVDYRGRQCWDRPDIGAYYSSSGDPAPARTAR